MLNELNQQANRTRTENGAVTYASSQSFCLDLFADIGAIRSASDSEILSRFVKAYAEDADMAMKILFFGRDVRGGLGERRVFRVILRWLADHEIGSVCKNLALIPEYGRFDDLIVLLGTACEPDAVEVIRRQLEQDLASDATVSLLAKWLPSVNASNLDTVRAAKHLAQALGMTEAKYRKTLAQLRRRISILENNLREQDYSFDYGKQPSRAMLKYQAAFLRHDSKRYTAYLQSVRRGEAVLHTGTLAPYDILMPCFRDGYAGSSLSEAERQSMDVTWNALEDFTGGENALVVVDGSGSMYCPTSPMPAAVALSLGLYFAERNRGPFRNCFITFSEHPQLVEIQGQDIAEKVRYCASFNEVANTDLQKVFQLILTAALENRLGQEDLPARLYIVSDMEFDWCMDHADLTNFAYAKELFARHGYRLPEVIFWNVASRHGQQPVTKNQQGAALVSGCSPRLFTMMTQGNISPWQAMLDVVNSPRYASICA